MLYRCRDCHKGFFVLLYGKRCPHCKGTNWEIVNLQEKERWEQKAKIK